MRKCTDVKFHREFDYRHRCCTLNIYIIHKAILFFLTMTSICSVGISKNPNPIPMYRRVNERQKQNPDLRHYMFYNIILTVQLCNLTCQQDSPPYIPIVLD